MKADLKFITPLNLVVESCRTCYESNWASDSKWTLIKDLRKYNSDQYVLGIKDQELVQQVIDSSHTSVLEHSLIHFEITGMPRFILQEFRTHRIGVSYSVESSRFTLKKKLRNETYISCIEPDIERISKYIYLSGIAEIDVKNVIRLENLREMVIENKYPNDKLKMLLPEVFLCVVRVSYNITSLRHFLKLRTGKDAHYLIRELAFMMYDSLPQEYKFLFKDVIGER